MDRSIVVAYDGSVAADATVRWGMTLAQRRKAPVRLLHVFDPSVYAVGLGGGYAGGSVAQLCAASEADVVTVRDRE